MDVQSWIETIDSAGDSMVEVYDLAKGDVCTAADTEAYWFEATSDEPFGFSGLWVPAPSETIWVVADDI